MKGVPHLLSRTLRRLREYVAGHPGDPLQTVLEILTLRAARRLRLLGEGLRTQGRRLARRLGNPALQTVLETFTLRAARRARGLGVTVSARVRRLARRPRGPVVRDLWGRLRHRLPGPTLTRLGKAAFRNATRYGLPSLWILAVLCVIGAFPKAPIPPPAAAPTPGPPSAVQRPAAPRPPVPRGDERFLIVGLTQDLHRTDTIMVAEWDAARQQARVLGVPRDVGVVIPGIGFTKLVHAFATGGIGRTRAAVVKLFDVPIAHYFVFSLPAMRQLVDLIGGVHITVEKRMVYTDREQGLYINLQPGYQLLDGAHAEQYLRFRNDPDGDIGRIRRQQHFLRAALAEVHRPANWLRLPSILNAAQADLGTDLTREQLLGWMHVMDHLAPDAVSAQTIEGRAETLFDYIMRMNLSFWVPDIDDLHAKVRWLLTGALPPPPKP